MRSKYYLSSFIVLGLIILLGIIGINHRISKSSTGEQKIVDNFEIYSGRINCKTIKLKVYDDNTYKVIHGYDNQEEIISTGTYKYDVTKILRNNHKYINDNAPYYLIDEDGKSYEIYDTNEELIKFLEEIDINLDTCLEYNY